MRRLLLFVPFVLTACQGSWADQTHVDLNPVAHSGVKGLALVSQGKQCDDQGHCRPGGVTIRWQLFSDKAATMYGIVAAKGTCVNPPTGGEVLTKFNGDLLKNSGALAQIDTPVIPFTNGDYVIVVRSGKRAVSCGTVRRTGPV